MPISLLDIWSLTSTYLYYVVLGSICKDPSTANMQGRTYNVAYMTHATSTLVHLLRFARICAHGRVRQQRPPTALASCCLLLLLMVNDEASTSHAPRLMHTHTHMHLLHMTSKHKMPTRTRPPHLLQLSRPHSLILRCCPRPRWNLSPPSALDPANHGAIRSSKSHGSAACSEMRRYLVHSAGGGCPLIVPCRPLGCLP